MNPLGLIAIPLSLVAFAITYARLRGKSMGVRLVWLGVFVLLALPAILFATYYLHILPERAWFYALRSWTGSEFLVVFLGCAAGAFATLLPRWLLGVPLFGLLALAVVPYLKAIAGPLPDEAFQDRWDGGACLQSTPSTCGAASTCAILKKLGVSASEKSAARAAFSYAGGTEAWYLARYVRSRGLVPTFDFRGSFEPGAGLPAMVGVRLGGAGHFIAVLDLHDDTITYADPLEGERRLSLSQFQRRYQFSGFHMVVRRP